MLEKLVLILRGNAFDAYEMRESAKMRANLENLKCKYT